MTDQASNLIGKDGRLFAEPKPAPDETAFQVDNTSAAYYDSPYYKKHEGDLQSVPKPHSSPPRIDLADVLGDDVLEPITRAKKISFHAVGDTGAARNDPSQRAATSIAHEAGVADAMTRDVATGGDQAPAFCTGEERREIVGVEARVEAQFTARPIVAEAAGGLVDAPLGVVVPERIGELTRRQAVAEARAQPDHV